MNVKNKNNVKEGDWVEYTFLEMNDSYNGSQGEVIEILPDDGWTVLAVVKWENGETSKAPVNNLYPQFSGIKSRAA